MCVFVIARHAESVFNVRGLVNGDHRQAVGLTARGEDQARRLRDQLRHLPITAAVCTRFLRTRRTAEIALADREVPLTVMADLDDIDVGALDGHTVGEFRSWKDHHRWSEPFPDGESLCVAVRRYAEAFRSVLEVSEPAVLVVCHAGPIRYLLDAADGLLPLAPSTRVVDNAVPYLFDEDALADAVGRLEAFTARPRARWEWAA